MSISAQSGDGGFDLESQDSGSNDQEECVWVNMPKGKRTIWEEEVGTVPKCIGGPFHSHPLIAAARFVLEAQACHEAKAALLVSFGLEALRGKVVDVGAAPKRTGKILGNLGHFMMPGGHIGDDTRLVQCPEEYRGQVCHCTFETCACIFDANGALRVPTAFVSVHSAYYLDRSILWRRLQDPQCAGFFAVGHTFDEPYGGFRDEADWEQHGSRITMRVAGQRHAPYQHDILPWTLDWRGPNGEAFEGEPIRSIMGFSVLWRVRAVIKSGDVAPRLFSDVISDDRYWGPMQFSNIQKHAVAVNSRVTDLELDVDHVEKVGKLLTTTATPLGGSPVVVCVPVDLIGDLAMRAVNHERDPNLVRDLTFKARGIVARSRVPMAEKPIVVATAVAIAMVTNLGVEIDVGHTIQNRFGWQFQALGAVLRFEPLRVWRLWRVILSSFLILAPPLVVTIVQHNGEVDLYAWLIGMALWVVFVLSVTGAVRLSRFIAKYSTARWAAWYRRGYTSHTPLFSIPSNEERLLPGSTNVRPPAATSESFRIVLEEDPRCPRAEPLPRAFLAGLVADTASVNVTEPTQESELSAVTHRIGREKSDPDWKTINMARDALQSGPLMALVNGYHVENSASSFYVWLRNQRDKYPAAVIEGWRVEWLSCARDLTKRSGTPFQKIELNSKPLTMDGQMPIKPRIIAPPSDAAKVLTAPSASQFYNRCVKVWDGLGQPILYASGRTTDEIGKVLDTWIAEFGGEDKVVGMTFDCSDYDSTLRHAQQFVVCELYRLAGFTDNVIGWFFETVVKGVTPHGVKYDMGATYTFDKEDDMLWFTGWLKTIQWDYTVVEEVGPQGERSWFLELCEFMMCSGRMDTNLMDTLFNAIAFFSYCYETKVDVRMMVCGDDNFSIMRSTECSDIWFNGLEAHLKMLGLEAVGSKSTSRHDWEFCSKLFWFGIDPATGQSQTVLGPKPGRAMTRMGITLSVPRAANIAATAISLKKDAHHVPFIRVVAERTYELCRQAKLRPSGRQWEGLRASKSYDLDPRNFSLCVDRYGLDRTAESDLTSVLAQCNTLPQFYHWEPIADMALRDAE
jgi:hypothetical protein